MNCLILGAQARIAEIEAPRPLPEEAAPVDHGPPKFTSQLVVSWFYCLNLRLVALRWGHVKNIHFCFHWFTYCKICDISLDVIGTCSSFNTCASPRIWKDSCFLIDSKCSFCNCMTSDVLGSFSVSVTCLVRQMNCLIYFLLNLLEKVSGKTKLKSKVKLIAQFWNKEVLQHIKSKVG